MFGAAPKICSRINLLSTLTERQNFRYRKQLYSNDTSSKQCDQLDNQLRNGRGSVAEAVMMAITYITVDKSLRQLKI